MPHPFYAHTLNDKGPADWEPLEVHEEVARRAADFAARFRAAPWARLAGVCHDLG